MATPQDKETMLTITNYDENFEIDKIGFKLR